MKALLLCLSFTVFSAYTAIQLTPADADNAVAFTIKNFGFNTKGEIKGLKGSIKWDAENPAASVFDVTADINTINTGIEMRDNHLKKEEYFDAANHPVISFKSTAVTASNITANLTIKGVTKQVSFPYKATANAKGYLFEGSFSIKRKDFNVGGGGSLGDNVNVTLKVQANR